MVDFQNDVRQFQFLTKMAAIAELSLTLNLMGNSLKFFSLEVVAHLIPKFSEMVTRWVPYRIVSDDPTRQPRWLPQPILV